MNDNDLWYVIYTRSRQEKILAEQLEESGFTVYLPLIKKESQWSDRKKFVEVPLFNSYVFIKSIHEKHRMKDFKPFVAFLQYNNKPAIVRPHEIETLKSIIKHGYDVSDAGDIGELKKGIQVLVIGGPLKGMTGELLSISDSDHFIINFENLGNSIQIKIPPRSLKKI